MPVLLLATQNPGKIREFGELLSNLNTTLVTPADVGVPFDVAETGSTYAANARLKAEYLAQAAGLLTLGDDSGLEVEALGGRPGLYSARYGGPDDAARRQRLVDELRDVPPPRPARFVAVVAVAHPEHPTRTFEGEVRGEILLEERGTGGFGYDPLFYMPDQGVTMAELPPALKNRLSHRARAVQAAWPYLAALLG